MIGVVILSVVAWRLSHLLFARRKYVAGARGVELEMEIDTGKSTLTDGRAEEESRCVDIKLTGGLGTIRAERSSGRYLDDNQAIGTPYFQEKAPE
jgi:hypothetical protein